MYNELSIKDEASEASSETGSESILPDASINLMEELEIEKVSDFHLEIEKVIIISSSISISIIVVVVIIVINVIVTVLK